MARVAVAFTAWAEKWFPDAFVFVAIAVVVVAAAAMMLAVPGATALGWVILPWCLNSRFMLVRVFGTVGGFLAVSGLFAGFSTPYLPAAKISTTRRPLMSAILP